MVTYRKLVVCPLCSIFKEQFIKVSWCRIECIAVRCVCTIVWWVFLGSVGSGGIEFGWLELVWVDSGEARCGLVVKERLSIATFWDQLE